MRVATGLDVLCAERLDLLRGRRVGVLCHPASVTSDLVHIVDRLIAAGVRPARLFGPEHGVRGEAQDMVGVDDGRDTRTGIPVTSLYGETFESLTPTAAELDGIDVLVVDLQDVGSRYYTYVWTMALALGAAARGAGRRRRARPAEPARRRRHRRRHGAGGLRVVRRAGRGPRAPRPDDRRDGAAGGGRDAVGRGALRAAARLRSDGGADARLAARR